MKKTTMKKAEMEALFIQTEPLLKDVVATCLNIYKVDATEEIAAELDAVVKFSFVKAVNYYDSSKGIFFSFLALVAKRDIGEYLKRNVLENKEVPSSVVPHFDKKVVSEEAFSVTKYVEALTKSSIAYLAIGSKALLLQSQGYDFNEIEEMLKEKSVTIRSYVCRTKDYIRANY